MLEGPAQAALIPLIHMTNHCHKSIFVNDSLILDLTENLKADRVMVGHLSCAVTIHAPPDARVYVHVLQLAISDHAQMPDRLHIYDVSRQGKLTKRLTPSTGLYGVLERPFLIYNTAGMIVPDFRSAGPRMRLDYQGKPTIIYRGFRVLVTAFYDPEANGKCRQGTVHCPYAGTCVPFSTRCDGFPNCGLDDNNDEKKCRREYVVSSILDEYSTRTAIIAAVTGIVVFLGVAALVFVVVLKYNRTKYSRSTDQSVRYTSRGGGACVYKNETDLSRLFAPPSYQDVMNPPGDSSPALKGRYASYRHSDPPPAYSAVAALVHQNDEGASSEDDTSGHKRPVTLWPSSATPPPASTTTHHPHHPPRSQRHYHPRGSSRAGNNDWEDEEEEDVRMHGTWPSDTDEEDEVRARRKKKGGKCKGKVKASSSRLENETSKSSDSSGHGVSKSSRGEEEEEKGAVMNSSSVRAEARGGVSGNASSPYPSPCPECHQSDCSPNHHLQCSGCPSAGSSNIPGSGAGSGGEVVSETESQLASSKRNSRTESHSPDTTSCGSSQTDSPAKPSLSAAADAVRSKSENSEHLDDLPSSPVSSSVQPLSPSVIPLDKLSSSEESLVHHQKDGDQNTTREEDFVDLNPAGKGTNRSDCVLHT
ncbi:hypothetical protein ACOMHN_014119 [Nucella lapillus]